MQIKVVKKGSTKSKPSNWCPWMIDMPPDIGV
jgi:hypothetical protein